MIRWLVYIDLFVLLRWEERSCWWSDVVPVFGYRAHAVANLQLLQLWSTLYGAISSSGSFRCRYRRWYESWLSLVAAAGKMIWWRRVTEWLAELRLSMPPAPRRSCIMESRNLVVPSRQVEAEFWLLCGVCGICSVLLWTLISGWLSLRGSAGW